MHILTNVHSAGPTGGMELSVFQVTRELAHRGHAVDVLYVQDAGFEDEYRSFCRRFTKVPAVDFSPRFLRHPRQQYRKIPTIWRGAMSYPDVVYAQRSYSAGWSVPVARLTRKPLVFHLRGFVEGLSAKRIAWFNREVDRFVVVSGYVGNQWASVGIEPSKILVIHNGIDPDEYAFGDDDARRRARQALGLADDLFVVTFIGRVDQEKGVEVLLDAWRALGLGPDEGRLLIVGSPYIHRHPAAYLAGLHARATASVQFIPVQRDVLTPLHAADVPVVPSVYDEPFGRSVIEGLSVGRPVVASRAGGIPEILTGELAKLLFEPGDAQELAQRLGGLIGWQETQPGLGALCRRHVEEEFTLNRTVDKLEGVFESLR